MVTLENKLKTNNQIPAGEFSTWLKRTRQAQVEPLTIDVACGECSACCTSSYFIHIKPEETETLARIPKELLFPAPGLPKGHKVLGFDERGFCPMFVHNACSIYDNRPHTCRTFDCRLFAAVGLNAGDESKTLINEQAKRWIFHYPTLRDHAEQKAVRDAIAFLKNKSDLFPDNFVPENPTQLALLAITVYTVFLSAYPTDEAVARAVIETLEQFQSFEK